MKRTITSATGGNFENLVLVTGRAPARLTLSPYTTLFRSSASTVVEGAVANYTFTATLSNPSQGDTTVVTDQGTITIGDGQTTGTLVIASNKTGNAHN